MKNSLGLFENPYKDADPQREKEIHLCRAHRDAARDAARKSAVLLKNQGVLPLKKGLGIGLAGPFAASVVRPVRELKGIRQVTIAPWDERTVVFTVTKDMLKFYNESLQLVFEPGEFDIMVGRNSGDVLTKRIDIK